MQLASRSTYSVRSSGKSAVVTPAAARPRCTVRSVTCRVMATGIDPGVIPGPPGGGSGVPGPSIIPPGRTPGGGDPQPGTVPDIDPGTPPSIDPQNVPGGVPNPGVGPGIDPGIVSPGSPGIGNPGVDTGRM